MKKNQQPNCAECVLRDDALFCDYCINQFTTTKKATT